MLTSKCQRPCYCGLPAELFVCHHEPGVECIFTGAVIDWNLQNSATVLSFANSHLFTVNKIHCSPEESCNLGSNFPAYPRSPIAYHDRRIPPEWTQGTQISPLGGICLASVGFLQECNPGRRSPQEAPSGSIFLMTSCPPLLFHRAFWTLTH